MECFYSLFQDKGDVPHRSATWRSTSYELSPLFCWPLWIHTKLDALQVLSSSILDFLIRYRHNLNSKIIYKTDRINSMGVVCCCLRDECKEYADINSSVYKLLCLCCFVQGCVHMISQKTETSWHGHGYVFVGGGSHNWMLHLIVGMTQRALKNWKIH